MDVFLIWEKDDEKVWKIVSIEDYGVFFIFFFDKVDFKGNIKICFLFNDIFRLEFLMYIVFILFFYLWLDKMFDRYFYSNFL